jgi:tyrosyl-tRNA synthetase
MEFVNKMSLDDLLNEIRRGTVEIFTEEELIKKLKQNRPLNVKFGIDPTAPDIHLGHTVPLQKLKQFQDLGHNIQLVIGDYTAMIGDPSGRTETRPMLSREEIKRNIETYRKQIFKILDPSRTNLVYNSQWLEKFSGTDIIKLGSKYTVQQLLQRKDFGERIKQNKPLSVTELLYPLLVGYDSVHLKSDIEIGGTDQLFNLMVSREIQKAYGQEPEVIITLPLLEGIDGIRKMSKSLGNAIGINDDPDDMYGKIMSISDDLMLKYYELLSQTSTDELRKIRENVKNKTVNPMEYKQRLAREIVSRYHGQEAAMAAEERFNEIHRKRKIPSNIEKQVIRYSTEEELSLVHVLRQIGRATSNSQAKRLIEQGGVKLDGKVIRDINYFVSPEDGQIIQIGKRYFRRLKFEKWS